MAKTYKQSELVVGVTYYTNRIEAVKRCGKAYETLFDSYYKYLVGLSEDAIVSGETSDVLKELIVQVGKANNMISEFCNNYSGTIKKFLKDIDNADDILFKNKGRKILTDKEFINAYHVARMEFSFKTLGVWFFELFSGPAGADLADKSLAMVKRVQELNSISKQELQKIRVDVRTVDGDYRNRLRNIYKEIRAYGEIIEKIDYIMTPASAGGSNNFTKKNVADLKKQIKALKELQKKTIENPENPEVENEDVKYFTETVENYWGDTTKTILAICQDSWGNLFLTDFEKFRETVDNAKEYFDQFSEEYIESKKNFDEKKAEFDRLLELYEKHGENYAKFAGEGDDIETFNKMIKKMKEISNGSDDYIDIWYQIFFDMSESKEALERYKANCDLSNENVRKALERIEALYDKEIDAYLAETFNKIQETVKEKGIKAAVAAIQKYLNKKGFLTRFIGQIGGQVVDQALTEMEIIAMYDWIESTGNTFETAAQKLKTMSSTDPGYEEMVQTVRETFEVAKKARLDFFKRMADVTKGTEKDYYEYCYNMIENASMNDFDQVDLLSLAEFEGSNNNPLTDLTNPENIFNN